MTKKKIKNTSPKIDPEREMALNSLPPNVKSRLTDAEIEMFLHDETWSEELFEKLKEFINGA